MDLDSESIDTDLVDNEVNLSEETYANLPILLTDRTDIFAKGAQEFEHLEMKSAADKIPDPPIPSFLPCATAQERQLQPAQKYGIAWMQHRQKFGGGIVADAMGMGKVYDPTSFRYLAKLVHV
jgi:SNF2 family DNA or RNA helicase